MTTQINTFTDIEAKDYATTGKDATINCVVLSDGELSADEAWTSGTYQYITPNNNNNKYQYLQAGFGNPTVISWQTIAAGISSDDITQNTIDNLNIPAIYKYYVHEIQYPNGETTNLSSVYPRHNSQPICYPILDCEELQIILPDNSTIQVTRDMWKLSHISESTSNSETTYSYWHTVELNKAELYLGFNNSGRLLIFTTESAGAPKYQYENLRLKIIIGRLYDSNNTRIDQFLYDVYEFNSGSISGTGFNYISFFSLTNDESSPTYTSKLLATRYLGYYIPFYSGSNITKIFVRVKSDRWDESKITIDVIFDPDYQEHLELVAGTDLELTSGVGFTPNHSVNVPQFIANDTTINITNNTNAKNIFQYVGNNPTRLQMDTNDYLNYSYYLWYYWKPDDIAIQLNIWYSYFGTWQSAQEKIKLTNDETTNTLPGPYIGFNDEFGSFLYSYWYDITNKQLLLILAGSNQYHHTDIYCIDMQDAYDDQLININDGTLTTQYRMKVNRWFNDIYFIWNNKLYLINVNPETMTKVDKTIAITSGIQLTCDIRNWLKSDSNVVKVKDSAANTSWKCQNISNWTETLPSTITIDSNVAVYYNSDYSLNNLVNGSDINAQASFTNSGGNTVYWRYATYLNLGDGSYLHYGYFISSYAVIYLNATTSGLENTYMPIFFCRTNSTVQPTQEASKWYCGVIDGRQLGREYLATNQNLIPPTLTFNFQNPGEIYKPEIFSDSNNNFSIYNPEFSDLGDIIIIAKDGNDNKRHYFLQPLIADQSLSPSDGEDLPSTVEIKIDELNAKNTSTDYNISPCFNQYTIDNPNSQTPLIAMYVLSVQHIRWLEEHEYEVYYIGPAYTVGRREINNKTQYLILSKTINGCYSENSCYNWERLRVILDESETIDSFADTGIIIKDGNERKYYELKDLAKNKGAGTEDRSGTSVSIIKDRYVTVLFNQTNGDANRILPRRIFNGA